LGGCFFGRGIGKCLAIGVSYETSVVGGRQVAGVTLKLKRDKKNRAGNQLSPSRGSPQKKKEKKEDALRMCTSPENERQLAVTKVLVFEREKGGNGRLRPLLRLRGQKKILPSVKELAGNAQREKGEEEGSEGKERRNREKA